MNNESHDSYESTESEEEVKVQASIVRRFGRARKQPERYGPPNFRSYFALSVIEEDPIIVKEVVDSTEGELWRKVMEEEMESLRKNDTWDLVELHMEGGPLAIIRYSRRKHMQQVALRSLRLD